jgi:hypothetical protein
MYSEPFTTGTGVAALARLCASAELTCMRKEISPPGFPESGTLSSSKMPPGTGRRNVTSPPMLVLRVSL